MTPAKKTAIVILNGISPKKNVFYRDYLPALTKIFDVAVHETLSRNDARQAASKYTDEKVDAILAAGGDGTLHQVVNGVLTGREDHSTLPALGVIPIGSGNDFYRGSGQKINVELVVKTLSSFQPRPIDVGHIQYSIDLTGTTKGEAYFINVADIGMGPEVVGKVLAGGSPLGTEVAYYKSILDTFMTYKPMVVKAVTANWSWEGKLRTLAVANGRYYGHGLCIAPDAVLDDRMFSVFICGNVSVFDFIMHTGTLKKGKNVMMDEVLYKTATDISCSSESPCPIEGDGEILGWLPARVKLIKKQLNFLF